MKAPADFTLRVFLSVIVCVQHTAVSVKKPGMGLRNRLIIFTAASAVFCTDQNTFLKKTMNGKIKKWDPIV